MIFFGTSSFSIVVLDRLLELGIKPDSIVTVCDKPQGRKLVMTPPPVKVWAESRGIPCMQFAKLDASALETLSCAGPEGARPDVFIVASYGKIIPQSILDIPVHGALNVHPSLLPKFRGASPLQSSILADEKNTGVAIIQMDKEMDHGPIVATKEMTVEPWPPTTGQLEGILGVAGAEILAEVLPAYLNGTAELHEQNHDEATYTKKFQKSDGEISLDELAGDSGRKTYLKFQALHETPGAFFFTTKKDSTIRVKVNEATWNESERRMELSKVTPESKKEMSFKDFENFLSA